MDRLIEYAGHHSLLVAAAVLVALVVLGYELRTRAQTIAAASPQDLIRLMNQGALVLDIRPQETSPPAISAAPASCPPTRCRRPARR